MSGETGERSVTRVPVGVCRALADGDFVAGTYRGHGHALITGGATPHL